MINSDIIVFLLLLSLFLSLCKFLLLLTTSLVVLFIYYDIVLGNLIYTVEGMLVASP